MPAKRIAGMARSYRFPVVTGLRVGSLPWSFRSLMVRGDDYFLRYTAAHLPQHYKATSVCKIA